MINISEDKCIGCGKCVRDCFRSDIEMKDGKAFAKNKACVDCSHCVAVCPAEAIVMQGADMSEVKELAGIDCHIDSETYLNHLKARRTIRKYKDIPVSVDDIKKIIEAGRYSPTGSNRQDVAYYVSIDNISEIKETLMKELSKMGQEEIDTGNPTIYSQNWAHMYDDYKQKGEDRLFFGAKAVIFISALSPQSAVIAAAHMETMVYSLGLGMLYCGFAVRAINHSDEIKERFRLEDDRDIYAVLVIGHPDIEYTHTGIKKPADVTWH